METQPTPEVSLKDRVIHFIKHVVFIDEPPLYVSNHYHPEHFQTETVESDQ